MGTPFVTLTGDALHTRLGASLLAVAGLDDLICASLDEYITCATALGNSHTALQSVRERLHANLPSCALFDIAGFARDFAALMRSVVTQ
jgi:predicted O-linked N-acetylglucosamine transferase (SPINDLY family)